MQMRIRRWQGSFLLIQFFPSNLNENLVLARKSILINLACNKKFFEHLFTFLYSFNSCHFLLLIRHRNFSKIHPVIKLLLIFFFLYFLLDKFGLHGHVIGTELIQKFENEVFCCWCFFCWFLLSIFKLSMFPSSNYFHQILPPSHVTQMYPLGTGRPQIWGNH